MIDNIFYHNPRCRKSREGLQLINTKNISFKIVEYLKSPPSETELKKILNGLEMKPRSLIRTQEKVFKELNLSKKDNRPDQEWIRIMAENPILIERPILIYNNKVALGRPPENLLNIIF
jgi:arsenate reductase